MSFQQEGTIAHTARVLMSVLRPLFYDHLISRFIDSPSRPRSSDLSICDNFLWLYLKARVYEHKLFELEDLKEAIQMEVTQFENQCTREWRSTSKYAFRNASMKTDNS